jgi:hypothetical protein
MLRALLIASLGLGAATATFADDDRGRHDRREYRQDRHDRGDSRHWQGRRDDGRHGRNDRRWDGRPGRDDHRRWDDRHGYRGDWRGRDRVYVVPAPRVYGYRPAPPRNWYPGWREPYRNGYRYWQNDRYWYAEPGRPALELSLVLPLR